MPDTQTEPLAETEAEAEQPAEPEPDEDDDEDGEDEGEPGATSEPPAAQGVSDRDRERAMAALDKEATRHSNRVSEIMGEEAHGLIPCPLCWTPGFTWPPGAGWPDPDRAAAVKIALGEALRPDYRDAEDAAPCPTCDALGVTLTGSKVPGQETKPCQTCNGSGWIAAHQGQPIQAPTPPLIQVPAGNGQTYTTGGAPDQWGRPIGHPHYGRDPASVYA